MHKQQKKLKEIEAITDKYGVYVLAVKINDLGKYSVLLDTNIYYKVQEKMEEEIRASGDIQDIDYKDIA